MYLYFSWLYAGYNFYELTEVTLNIIYILLEPLSYVDTSLFKNLLENLSKKHIISEWFRIFKQGETCMEFNYSFIV